MAGILKLAEFRSGEIFKILKIIPSNLSPFNFKIERNFGILKLNILYILGN